MLQKNREETTLLLQKVLLILETWQVYTEVKIIYLFIYYYSTEGPKATYTVGKSTRIEKRIQNAINKTQGNRNQALHIKITFKN